MPMIICVTGKAGSGKTTSAGVLKSMLKGSKIINADAIGISLLRKNQVKRKLVKQFGREILSGGKVSRKKLAAKAFSSKASLAKLNSISHPFLVKEIRIATGKEKTAIIDAALYDELKLGSIADTTILVRTADKTARKRLPAAIFARRKYHGQPKNPDFIINNNSSKHALRQRLKSIAKKLSK